jgi:predicted acylesterase/phospholipase RssA
MTNNKQQTAVEWLWEIAYNRELTVQDWKQAKEMYQDEIEAAIIKDCATDSTLEASQYASGYSSGYQRALEMVKWKIDNELRSK